MEGYSFCYQHRRTTLTAPQKFLLSKERRKEQRLGVREPWASPDLLFSFPSPLQAWFVPVELGLCLRSEERCLEDEMGGAPGPRLESEPEFSPQCFLPAPCDTTAQKAADVTALTSFR